MKTLILLFSVLFTTMSFTQVPSYVPANGLLGWWPFNGNAHDESGNGNNGTVSGATLTTDLYGDANSAYIFDGINDYINAGDFYNFNNSNFTISVWFVQIGPTSNALISKREVNGLGNWWHLTLNTFLISASNNGPFLWLAPLHENFNKYTWTNYTITREGNVISFFANGILSSQDILSTTYNMNNNANLIFGSLFFDGAYGDFHNGKLDDIGIWNRALTDCEIQNLYTSTNPTNLTSQTACDSYTWNGTNYTASGVYTGTTTNCVTEFLNLTITPSSTNTTSETTCDSYTWNGTSYSESGVYTGTTANCVTESLNLTIIPSSTNTTTATACDSYLWNGTSYSESGVYIGTTANCVTESLNLTITQTFSDTTIVIACDSYTWNGTTYTESGTYTGITENCITQSLKLTINPSTSSSISQTALDSYTWLVNNQTYTTTGAYTTVIPNTSGCDSTITLNLTMSFTGINDLSASKLSIYPNPTNGDFTITGLELVGTVSSLTLTDMNGKVVKVLDTKATKFSMASIKPGVYFLNIISGNKEEVLKIVKE